MLLSAWYQLLPSTNRIARSGNFGLLNEKPGVWPKPDAGGLTPSPLGALATTMLAFSDPHVNAMKQLRSPTPPPNSCLCDIAPCV